MTSLHPGPPSLSWTNTSILKKKKKTELLSYSNTIYASKRRKTIQKEYNLYLSMYVSKFVLQLWKILNPFTEHKNTNDPVLYYKFILVHLWMSVWVQKKNKILEKFFCVLSNQNKTFLLIMTCLSVILTAWLRNLSGKLIIIIHIHTQVANSWEREEERNNLTTYWILELEKCK